MSKFAFGKKVEIASTNKAAFFIHKYYTIAKWSEDRKKERHVDLVLKGKSSAGVSATVLYRYERYDPKAKYWHVTERKRLTLAAVGRGGKSSVGLPTTDNRYTRNRTFIEEIQLLDRDLEVIFSKEMDLLVSVSTEMLPATIDETFIRLVWLSILLVILLIVFGR